MSAGEDRFHVDGYPAYRRMKGTGRLFRIDGPRRFSELQPLGKHWLMHEVDASAYPEQVRVQEMLLCAGGAYEIAEASEWETALSKVHKPL